MFLEQFKQVAAADMEVLGDIGDGDIQDGAFVDVVDGSGDVKVVKGVRISTALTLKFMLTFLEHIGFHFFHIL